MTISIWRTVTSCLLWCAKYIWQNSSTTVHGTRLPPTWTSVLWKASQAMPQRKIFWLCSANMASMITKLYYGAQAPHFASSSGVRTWLMPPSMCCWMSTSAISLVSRNILPSTTAPQLTVLWIATTQQVVVVPFPNWERSETATSMSAQARSSPSGNFQNWL